MTKKILTTLAVSLSLLCLPVLASDKEDDISRIDHATQVFHEIQTAPDGIPATVLKDAKCIAIIPGEKKFAFIFGGNYGRGVATCRHGASWSAPMFVAIDGGSVGYQIGGSSTDLIMVFMNDHALQNLMSDKFKLGGDASVAAGPVGRQAAADTDISLRAEILAYSRSRGVFAGISLDGAVVQTDQSGDHAMYGDEVTHRQILDGKITPPDAARPLLREIRRAVANASA
jgi:lipid-binding SYLF domain-containing protein